MKIQVISRTIEKDALGFFCFHNRMCEQNRFHSLSDLERNGKISSGSVLLIQKPNSIHLAAFLTAEHSEPKITVTFENKLPVISMKLYFDGNGDVPEEKYLLCEFDNLHEALLSLKKGLSSKRKISQAIRGWCSWYQYFINVSEDDIIKNLKLAYGKKDISMEYFQIDMGFSPKVGDWTLPSENFPDGVAHLPEIIKNAGMKPGIWLAPFTAELDSVIYQKHPEWFHAEDNYIWKPLFNTPPWKAIDLSHPEAFNFVMGLGQTFKDMGYEYFKLDFLDMGVLPGRRFCNKLSGVELYRKALSEFKKIVQSPVLACNPVIPSTYDIVDAMRINQDTAPFWHAEKQHTAGAEEALLTAFSRLFLNGEPTTVDPDCILLRRSQTELTNDEIETYSNIVKASSGALFISDDLSLVPDDNLKTAFKKMPYDHITAFPEGLFEQRLPYRLNLYAKHKQIGELIINWSDSEQEMQVSGKFRKNHLDNRELSKHQTSIKLRAHQSVIFLL